MKKSFLTLAASMLIVGSLLTACGGNDRDKSPANSDQHDQEDGMGTAPSGGNSYQDTLDNNADTMLNDDSDTNTTTR
jgi:hypothetical protein